MKKALITIFAIIGVISTVLILLGVGYLLGTKDRTSAPIPTVTATPEPIPTVAVEAVASTETPVPTSTTTPTVAPTATSTPSPTPTATSTPTPTSTPTNTPTPTPRYTFTEITGKDKPRRAIEATNVYCEPTKEGFVIDKAPLDRGLFALRLCNETGLVEINYYSPNLGDINGWVDPAFLVSALKEEATPTPTQTPTPTPKPTATPAPTKAPSISASKTELVFTSTEPQTFYIKVENNKSFTLSREFVGDTIVTSEWGEWQEYGVTIPVTITPMVNGTTTIKYYINDTKAYVNVNVTVDIDSLPDIPELGEEEIVVSQTGMIFTDTEPQILYIKVKDRKEIYGSWIGNASYKAGKWSGNVLPVVITPTSSGTSTFEISLAENDSVRVTVNIHVEIYPEREMFTNSKTVPLEDAYIGSTVKFGAFEQDNNLSNGAEEIEWLVLDVQDGKALLLSKYALDCQRFGTWSGDGRNWTNSLIRHWLKDDFYEQAFSTSEQVRICEVDNGATVYSVPPDAEEDDYKDMDKIFLLSYKEVEKYFNDEFLSDEYGDSLLKRTTSATPYALSRGAAAWLYKESETYGLTRWWLRDVVGEWYNAEVYCIEMGGTKGALDPYGYVINPFTDEKTYYACCVRPAVWVEIE